MLTPEERAALRAEMLLRTDDDGELVLTVEAGTVLALLDQIDALEAEGCPYCTLIGTLEQQLERLREYADHDMECGEPCSCGLDVLLAELEGSTNGPAAPAGD